MQICDMPSPKGDPTYIKNKEGFFMDVAKVISNGSTHPKAAGGCVITRDREIIGDGRSLLTHSKVEIDCVSYAVAAACKRGTPTTGAVVYTTRYPFSTSVFQCHLMGIRQIYVLAHEWEAFYKDEFRRAARLARELNMSIEPVFDNEDPRFAQNAQDIVDKQVDTSLYTDAYKPDEYDPELKSDIQDED